MTAEVIPEAPVADTSMVKTAATKRRLRIEKYLGLSERPTTARRAEMGGWMAGAACAGRGDLGLTEVDRQDDADEIITMFCDRCPVADACLAEGRTAHGSGVYGGLVLDDGALARDADRLADAFHDPSVWIAPAPTLEVVSDGDVPEGTSTEPTKAAQPNATTSSTLEEVAGASSPRATKGAGQRRQPRRRTLSQRRRGRR